jgi:predicted N-formylglutamate amidohydrolase
MVASPVHLLAPDEKPAFEVVNAQGRGRALFLCDHASAAVPRALRDLGLAPEHFGRHIAWDIGAAEVARRLSRAFDAPLVLSGYSRLVIDCNRRPGDATSIPEESDRTPVPGNRGLSPADRAARATACFEPYHNAIAQRLAAFATRDETPAVISIHSCTPVFNGFERPWHFGVLWNRDGRLAEPLMARLRAISGVVVGDNQPYSARDGHGYTLERHAESAGLPHVLVEVRQDLIATAAGADAWAERLGAALAPLLEAS